MIPNNELKIHFVNVNHGDATILEFPDYGSTEKIAHFGVVDFGAKLRQDRALTTEYMNALIALRSNNESGFDYVIDFVCATHPHDDHFGGLNRFMDVYATAANNRIRSFWDCGFRTNSINYNRALERIIANDDLTFIRVSAGAEFEFGNVRITILAPSVDLRNRFDTFGIDKNNASIVLKIKYDNSYIILAADAQFASWGKTTEEFPRQRRINFLDDALGLAERGETSDQLKCNLLKLSHHGSKHGTSLEYLERLKPAHIVIPAGSDQWYQDKVDQWQGYFPHPLIREIVNVLNPEIKEHITGEKGNLIFKYNGDWVPREVAKFLDRPDGAGFAAALAAKWK